VAGAGPVAAARRERLLAALLRRIRALAARRPVLAVVEDAHWLDPTTRELLDLLVAEAPTMAALVVVTHRPEFDATAWLGQPHVTPVQLNRLAPAEHAALLRRVAGGKALPPEVEAEILARTEGVPLFVEEVARAVLEGGLLREEADRWALDGASPQLAVPASLQASLVARLDRLSGVREVAQVGAAIGREFAHDLVAAASGLPERRLREALEGLVAADLVQRRGVPPDAVYAFRHALIQDAAYGTLLRERRRDLHRRVAEAIGRLRPDAADREPEVLAHHWAEAGEAETAAAHYLRAGERAAARPAMREARAHLARGLALLPAVREEAARRLEVGLQIALGNVAVAAEGLGAAETGRAFGRAVELCRGLGGDAPLAWALRGLWTYKLHTGDLAGALRLAEEAVELARRRGAPSQRQVSLCILGVTQYLLGRYDLARPLLQAAAAGPDAFEVIAGTISGGSLAQSFLMRVLPVLGALERSAALTAEAIERARQVGHLPSLADMLIGCCTQAWLVRDTEAMRCRSAHLVELAEAHGFPYFASRARCFGGWVAVEEGRVPVGIGLIAGNLAFLRRAGNVLHTSQVEAMLSDAHLLGGEPDAPSPTSRRRSASPPGPGRLGSAPSLHRRLGCVLLRLGPASDGPARRRVPARAGHRAVAVGEAVRAARRPRPRPALARPGARRRGARAARAGLRVLHRRLRTA
jgi:tetratricopeptide (TPR) repeat protein